MNEASDIVSVPDIGHIENFEELVASSDLVVIGTVDKVHPASKRNINLDKSETSLPYYAIYTDSDIKVEKIILGNINQNTQNMFTMKQAGGLYDGKEYMTYAPIVEEGKTYLFFLATFDKYDAPEEPYTLVGTEEVVAPVEDGIVKFHPSLSLTNPLATKQIMNEKSVDHDVALKIDDVIAEIIRVDNYLPDPIDDVDLNSLK
ncbi:hypothetical protein MNQ98_17650 [Paenibacillus sp. N3/727]|uniref:hypothetical protein n=1 Tax=Paenibacillus sp. N3/727 TaxID=2925845 RepID=UPI001F531462|nr:hypothetical protein [Paenibacillus sp. N3/727]UNK16341.1 hypothetical protein MNQ98_17650 [Paenibacillus sp. N3/727]